MNNKKFWESGRMKNQINQVDISYNGSIVIMGEIDGQSVYWTLTQEQMLKLLKDVKIELS